VTTKAGQTYVGQSGNVSRRLAEHVADGKITQSAANNATKFEVLGGKTSREVAEQRVIDARGGLPSLANRENPVGGRYGLLNNQQLGVISKDNLINWRAVVAFDVFVDSLLSSSSAQAAGSAGGTRK